MRFEGRAHQVFERSAGADGRLVCARRMPNAVSRNAQAARVACFPVSTAADLVKNAQLEARQFFETLSAPNKRVSCDAGLTISDALQQRREPGAGRSDGHFPSWRNEAALNSVLIVDAASMDEGKLSGSGSKSCLRGLRVVDFSWVVAGPMATKRLGALGAEIIKIKSTTRPEFAYREGWFSGHQQQQVELHAQHRLAGGTGIILDLVRTSDVVVENFSSRVLDQKQSFL